ncbi:hypothetical protein KGP36_01615 [Patescibacteria group bacterium]|nr:hypothetical protein [Patescibacteria group bacterium]
MKIDTTIDEREIAEDYRRNDFHGRIVLPKQGDIDLLSGIAVRAVEPDTFAGRGPHLYERHYACLELRNRPINRERLFEHAPRLYDAVKGFLEKGDPRDWSPAFISDVKRQLQSIIDAIGDRREFGGIYLTDRELLREFAETGGSDKT